MKLVLVANPRAGAGRAPAAAERACVRLRSAGFEVAVRSTESAGHARAMAKGGDFADAVPVAVGGDGTLHELVDGLLGRDDGVPTVAVFPCGAGNSLARDLGLAGVDDAVARLVAGAERSIDVARVRVDGRTLHALNLVGWGAVARINRRAERMRWARGLRYTLASVVELLRPRLRDSGARVDGARDGRELLGALCISAHVGNGIPLAPAARLDDGELDLVRIHRAFRPRLAWLLAAAYRGAHVGSPLVSIRRVSSLRLDLDPGEWINVDGENRPARAVEVEVRPAALRVLA